ncbi:MAG TPA: LssY C-terminal domain-containing protein [Candidatus Omnitrophota bacterium]|nr:LssY C-terminal domain-containing protein [Candidatus Omnitrophota bacterium]
MHRWCFGCGLSALFVVLGVLFLWFALPKALRHYEHQASLASSPKTAQNRNGLPSDPLNIALIGSREEILRAFLASGWRPADPITLKSGLEIASSVLLNYPYPTAPVSNLYLWGRPQDLAFEQEVGKSARHRHHVRLWKTDIAVPPQARPLWLGAATFDQNVGFKRRSIEPTHHIAPDIDAERDGLMQTLLRAGCLVEMYQVTGPGQTLAGRNGSGDWYYTDGELTVGVISPGNTISPTPPEMAPNPPVVRFKNTVWIGLKKALRRLENAGKSA